MRVPVRKLVAAFEDAQGGENGSITVEGQLVDLPVVLRAQRILELSRQLGISDREES